MSVMWTEEKVFGALAFAKNNEVSFWAVKSNLDIPISLISIDNSTSGIRCYGQEAR